MDLQPDGKLRSLYAAQEFVPEALIRADFEVLQARVAQLMRATMLDEGDRAKNEAEVEAQLPFNCEHVVPQSWFAKAEPMRGDLHHLFACETRCIGFRGNSPYADFPDFPQSPLGGLRAMEIVRGDCGKSESSGFEPANGKGAAARAACHFRLRYPGLISVEEMPEDRWDVVATWHEQDPVTMWERHRNATIFKRQGNRNHHRVGRFDCEKSKDHVVASLPLNRRRHIDEQYTTLTGRNCAVLEDLQTQARSPSEAAIRGLPLLAQTCVTPPPIAHRGAGLPAPRMGDILQPVQELLEVEHLRHSRPQPVATSRLRPQRESTSVRTNHHRNVPQARGGAGSSHHIGAEGEQREEAHQH